jgi:hypothetical protein
MGNWLTLGNVSADTKRLESGLTIHGQRSRKGSLGTMPGSSGPASGGGGGVALAGWLTSPSLLHLPHSPPHFAGLFYWGDGHLQDIAEVRATAS